MIKAAEVLLRNSVVSQPGEKHRGSRREGEAGSLARQSRSAVSGARSHTVFEALREGVQAHEGQGGQV